MDKKKGRNGIRPLKYMSLITLFLCFLVLAGFAAAAYCWNHETTHKKDLTGMALELLNLVEDTTKNQEYSPEIWKEFADFIKWGARDEDLPCLVFQLRETPSPVYYIPYVGPPIETLFTHSLRANNHYGHGIVKGVGLTNSPLPMGDKDTYPLDWAKTNRDLKPEEEFNGGKDWWRGGKPYNWSDKDLDNGNMSWKNAIDRYGYTRESKALAYYTLGFILHLLQDMGNPEHVHDDPHGASSINGFEIYMENNWDKEDKIKPDMTGLRPWRPKDKGVQGGLFSDIDPYFDHLGKLAYSSNRFKGFINDPKKIEKGSDLEKMFDVEEFTQIYNKGPGLVLPAYNPGWRLKNKPGRKGGDRSLELKYFPGLYGREPAGHKGVNSVQQEEGEFWPTSRELENIGKKKVDAKGYYYIELSGDLPHLSGKRDLYPMAYLPSPLDVVKDECKGWEKENPGGAKHLYYFIAKNMAPHIVEHSAGLIQHYFDIVNHPPYVVGVEVTQREDPKYKVYWKDLPEIDDATKKSGEKDPSKYMNELLHPGETYILISFSEPVDKPKVIISTQKGAEELINLQPIMEGTVWRGYFKIPEEGPQSEKVQIIIEASDLNRHYGDEGGQLDPNPETPARRRVSNGGYEWKGYEYKDGGDRNHFLRVIRYPTEVKIKSIYPIVPDMTELTLRKSSDEGTYEISAPNPIRIKADHQVKLDIEYEVSGKPGEQVKVKIEPSIIGWVRYPKEPKPRLRLTPIEKTVTFGYLSNFEAKKTERASLSFNIPYPSQEVWDFRMRDQNHAIRLDLMVNDKPSKSIVIRCAFEVEGPGTDFAGRGDLDIRILLSEKDADKEAYFGEYWCGPVKVILQPLSGQSAPRTKVFGDGELKRYWVWSLDDKQPPVFQNIPLGRYRIVAEVQGSRHNGREYKGPRTGSATVTLFKWNPAHQHAGGFSVDVRLGSVLEEKRSMSQRPSFVKESSVEKEGVEEPKPSYIKKSTTKISARKPKVGDTPTAPSSEKPVMKPSEVATEPLEKKPPPKGLGILGHTMDSVDCEMIRTWFKGDCISKCQGKGCEERCTSEGEQGYRRCMSGEWGKPSK